ncbi:cell cycle arrest protein [Spathaspora passalidarum NRRL Y-27907]|uniref:Cell cycle arrest protein n=1 Tax=Spathaspora passalidarum (strain NRRL Y-27907 / 11-Y1) TaxID=619300 RepID=G3AP23_SPAPN|nr:cell cycle arrest protein [Spathaspora passalidarum NRRL Y-27907]EGW32054.1 cell cycle arrest protein [Spathaspora passalidarum NRRL Y-27907]
MTIPPHFIELNTPSKELDIISDLKFSPTPTHDQLLVSTWNNEIFMYELRDLLVPHAPPPIDPVQVFNTSDTPLCLLSTSTVSYAGLLDGTVRELDFENGKLGGNIASTPDENEINGGINNICQVSRLNSIICSTFNGKLQLIDQRQRQSVQTYQNKAKIFTMDVSDQYLTCGLTSNMIEIYDFRKLDRPVQTRQVGLKYQIKDLKTFPNNEGFALSTIDGRVSIEYFDSSPEIQQHKRFTFKCHRHQDETTGADLVYPVNSIAFNKKYSTLFTSGSDGTICLWDCEKRKRMRQYPKFLSHEGEPESIVKIGLSHGDELIAVATSDDNYKRRRRLSEGQNSRAPSRLYVKQLSETECMPKK